MSSTKLTDIANLFKDQKEMKGAEIYVSPQDLSHFWIQMNIKTKTFVHDSLIEKASQIPKNNAASIFSAQYSSTPVINRQMQGRDYGYKLNVMEIL